MKKYRIIAFLTAVLLTLNVWGQSYETLWKQVEKAQGQDLPQTAINRLQSISRKAAAEKAYGHLLKATLLEARLQSEVAPDSLEVAVRRLEQREETATNETLQAVYATVLTTLLEEHGDRLGDDVPTRKARYHQHATAHPEALAKVKAAPYEPFVVKGLDSECFGHDLLSVVGAELGAWHWLHQYYQQAGNRRAACLAALEDCRANCRDIQQKQTVLDSLLQQYGDLSEACEVAIERYWLMRQTDQSAADCDRWLRQALQRWGTWKRADVLRNALAELTQSTLHVTVQQPLSEVGRPQMLRLTGLRHLDRLTLRVWRTTLRGDNTLNANDDDDYKTIRKGATELPEQGRVLTFTGHADYDVFEDSLQLAGLSAGVYLLEFTSQPKTETVRMLYYVSALRVLRQVLPGHRIRYVVVDATTGQPVGGARLRLSWNRYNQKGNEETFTCDALGEYTFQYTDNRQPREVYAFTEADGYCLPQNSYGSYSYYEPRYASQHTQLFTDRAIYRPGQTVHVAAIVWREKSQTENVAVADKTVTIELRDANYELVGEQKVTTDRYGKCATDFTLPTGRLNGRYVVRCNGTSATVRVEEYRRPSFQVTFADYRQSYRAGDTVRVEGKAESYAGVPVQDGLVKYTVKRRVAFWWMNYSRYWQQGYLGHGLSETVVGEGTARTADDGTFPVEMPLTLPEDMGRQSMFYHFVVEADVTDQAGETHQGTLSLPLGNKVSVLTCDLPEKVRSDQMPALTFRRQNAAGQEMDGTVRYRLDGKKWQTYDLHTPPSTLLPPQLKSGQHHLEAVCEGDTLRQDFVVFSLDDQKPAVETDDWFYVSHSEFPADGSPVTVQVGASDADMHIVYSLLAGDKVIESGSVKRDGRLVNCQFSYLPEYGSGLLVTYAWMKNGRSHLHKAFIRRPMPDRQLRLTWETFRDRLTPGQQEQWRLRVTHADGSPADASLMAVLYDKSLDAITPHRWSFAPKCVVPQPSTSWQSTTVNRTGLHATQPIDYLQVEDLSFSRFDHDVYPYYHRLMIRGTRMYKANRANAIGDIAVTSNEDAVYAMASMDAVEQKSLETAPAAAGDMVSEEQAAEVSVRENLAETAFCYPQLHTDADGQVALVFTLPEALTTWRFMGVANTMDMCYGQIDAEAVAQKELMVQPNMPRFLRQGDEATISMRIINMGQQTMKNGTALLRLYDAESEILSVSEPFEVEAGKTTAVSFRIPASVLKPGLLTCKVSAIATTAGLDGFSDGEQHYLPVLPDKEYVTKTVPYTQHEAGVKTIDLTTLFPAGTTDRKLTMEYTNQPAWLMVQALPTLGQPSQHCAIDQAASYYSNLLALALLRQNPQVKQIYQQWKQEEDPSPLTSHLSKNDDLKDLVLQETPWVLAADRETEQRQRLTDFFDENTINYRLSAAVEKLKELQNPDGSFSWYPGMDGSTSITVAVTEMLARLQVMVGNHSSLFTLHSSFDKAFQYVGKEMTDLVAKMKKEEKKGHRQTFPSFTALRWLYLCALNGRTLSTQQKAANDYLVTLLKKEIKHQTIYEKALTAVILAQRGEKTRAANYVKSLKEYTVYTEEMGRYYDTPRAAYSWYDYRIPTEVAAIEAIQRVTPADRQTVDEMRRWLLQEKRTQTWDTPINSVNAIYAFLNGNSSTLTTSQPATALVVDGKPIDTSMASAGLGYVKTAQSYNGEHTFTATKTSEGTSWGAVYAQFFQKTAEVEASASGIQVKREILVSKTTAAANSSLITHHSSLEVGDRIRVRLTIETSRDLDFVQLIDRRAACMQPVNQLSGYQDGAYASPKDYATQYFFGRLPKGRHLVETEYYIDRAGDYETGTCTVGCAYAPEFRATAPSITLHVERP